MITREKINALFMITRPWSFSMTIISVSLAAAVGSLTGPLPWGPFFIVLTAMVLVHSATNAINDYFDVQYGIDTADSPTAKYRKHHLVTGTVKSHEVLIFSLFLYLVVILIGVFFLVLRGWPIAAFAAGGAFASVFYTGKPINFKYRGAGEFAVFFIWGPLMMAASYYALTGTWEHILTVVFISIPQGLWVLLVLLANNMRDIRYDKEKGAQTLAVLISYPNALRLFIGTMVTIYCVTTIEILFGILPPLSFITFGSLPFAVALIRTIRQENAVPEDADPKTARVGMVYGLLLLLSLILHYTG